nr:transcriptional regulator NrdR [uncultured Anaeromusa sp.]
MRCPFCAFPESKVIDSRAAEEGVSIRRRRECLHCQRRFTTYEVVEKVPVMVVKKDGRREMFDKAKLQAGLMRACEKRPVSLQEIEELANQVERDIYNTMEREISSREIGERVMNLLQDVDPVAYVRFASVYRQFTDLHNFKDELESLLLRRQQGPSKSKGRKKG